MGKPVNCPQCGVAVETARGAGTEKCAACGHVLDIAAERAKSEQIRDTGVSVIRYEGDNKTFIWKHPAEDFNFGSQLIVHESQEAIFFLNGEALDTFGPGRHTLETENIPILKKIYRLPTGAQTPFHAEVYFINKTVQMGVKWGTDSRVRFIDPVTGIPLDIGARGEMNLSVGDSRKLLVTLVGTESGLTQGQIADTESQGSALRGYFRALLMTEIKSCLARTIREQKINILEIDERLSDLSALLKERIAGGFAEYGLLIPQFYVTGILLPEEDGNFKKIRQLISDAYLGVRAAEVSAGIAAAERQAILEKKTTELETAKFDAEKVRVAAQGEADAGRARGLSEAQVMTAKGYTQKDVLDSEVQKAYAEGIGNMGGGSGSAGGSMVSDIVGVVAGVKAAGLMGDQLGNLFGGQGAAQAQAADGAAPAGWECACGRKDNGGQFCQDCGKPREELWSCACGHGGNKGKFCESCGKPRESLWSCACGHGGNRGKFCEGCGKPKE